MTQEKYKSFFKWLEQQIQKWSVFLPLMCGAATLWVVKESLAPLLFDGKTFSEIHWALKITLLAGGFLSFSLLFIGLFWLLQRVKNGQKHEKPIDTHLRIPAAKRVTVCLAIIGIGATATLFINNVYSSIDIESSTFVSPKIIPSMPTVGDDFRTGLYRPPKLLILEGRPYEQYEDGTFLTQYPPLVNLLYFPFQLFSEDTAYLIHAVLLFAAMFASLALTTLMIKDHVLPLTELDPSSNSLIAFCLFGVFAALTFTGYPFLFSIERGNYDITALFCSLLAVYLLLKKPGSLWAQVILLSIATHLKIYPAALFIVVLAKNGKKMILPTLAVNVVFLFSMGWYNALTFLRIISHSVSTGFPWVGNHSGFSFATYLSWIYQSTSGNLTLLRNLFSVIPVFVWASSAYSLLKVKISQLNFVLLSMACLPLMDVLPPISHDYKSVLLAPVTLTLAAMLIVKIVRSSNFWDYVQLVVVMGITLILNRSFALNPEPLILLNNKYMLILLLAVLLWINLKLPGLESAHENGHAALTTVAPQHVGDEGQGQPAT